jgi:hypothetical protein
VNVAGSGNTDKCGQCYEVMCVDGPTRGMPGSRFGAEAVSACHDPGRKSVVVEVTDSCPCNYPANAASNSMWCCGDVPHFDLGYAVRASACACAAAGTHLRSFCAAQAFDVIANRGKGVVDLVWRQVDCSKRKYSVTSY